MKNKLSLTQDQADDLCDLITHMIVEEICKGDNCCDEDWQKSVEEILKTFIN